MSIPTQKAVHLSGLNGFRALAATGVVISHIIISAITEFGLNPHILGTEPNGEAKGLQLAAYGVTIFFVLSGFLITFLLLKEKELQPVNIKHFYVRRILRIWPLYYLYLVICLIVMFALAMPREWTSLSFYIFMVANVPLIVKGINIPLLLGHYWSLGVEEQFYAFWPWIAKQENSKLLKWAVGLTIGLILLKMVFWQLSVRLGINMPYVALSITRFQCMMIGAVGAIFFYMNNGRLISMATNLFTQIVCWVVILFIIANRFHIASVLDHEIVSVVTLFLIIAQVTRKNRIINLDNPLCNFLGKISFGIYVYHMLVIFAVTKVLELLPIENSWKYGLLTVLVLGITVLVAYVSYQFFEKRFLVLKHNYSAVNSSDTAEKTPEVVVGK